jgi:hypothetical protein
MKTKMMRALTISMLMLAFTVTSPAFERHPEISKAIDALQRARQHLMEASHDFGGHKADAIRAVDEAIHQLQICLGY